MSEPKMHTIEPNEPPDVRAIIDPMGRMTASKRVLVFSAMRQRWCLACGAENEPHMRCRCSDVAKVTS